ncbi:hypothetical protein AK812_SmicGene36960 [Symbiodinium microadriaticum]|uniref:Uncharacterized protein n=1 Tax=Symbiodinium microadriaticum TaxID=2951 RepID=A0A1Q9CHJ4_SYMMI|nr:hypothetical protein AK812_SmicGene36960 [Symbiodinium microadriaticum]
MLAGMEFLKEITETVLYLAKLSSRSKKHAELLRDVAWTEETMPLELMSGFIQSGYDAHNEELREMLRRLKSGTASTKDLLESTFAHLTDVAQRHAKNDKLGFYSRWLYAVCSPYGRESAPQTWPSDTDWFEYRTSDANLNKQFLNLGNIKGQHLPEIVYGEDGRFPQKPSEVVYRSALFTQGCCFYHTPTDQFFMSLGFRKWGALGLELSKRALGHQEYLTLEASATDSPYWMFDLENWVAVEVRAVLPCCTPEYLQGSEMVLEILNAGVDVVYAAIKRGTFLTVECLRALVRQLKVPLGPGSGKNDRVLKKDLAAALVGFLFPGEDMETQQKMISSILGQKASVDLRVLHLVAGLDAENADDRIYKKMKQQATEELHKRFMEKGRKQQEEDDKEARDAPAAPSRGARRQPDPQAPPHPDEMKRHEESVARVHKEHVKQQAKQAERRNNLTPADLKQFLPGGGAIADQYRRE